jgi:hypothetical protein
LCHETLTHSYPFCWRSGTPLIYKAVPGWFVRVSELKDRMVAHNKTIAHIRDVVRLGRKLRERQEVKTRQPLRRLTVVHHEEAVRDMKEAARLVEGFGQAELSRLEGGEEVVVLGQPVGLQDVVVRRESRAGTELETEGSLVVALDFELDPGLLQEGIARELVSVLQKMRKEAGLSITQRISVSLETDDELVLSALEAQRGFVANEVLATHLERGSAGGELQSLSSVKGEHQVRLLIAPV